MQRPHLAERARRTHDENTAKVLDALLAAGAGGLTTAELMVLTGLSRTCVRLRVQAMHGKQTRICDYRDIKYSLIEAWGLGNAPDLTKEEWRRRADADAEEAMCADIQRNHACWAAKWKARRDAAAAWI
ncbi:hypothetical protein KTE26_14175 [Ralstonia mannitolilytica]|uniref:hypothetical protein n=1 Tax=Ralstonia mannitolilytica TaxID=105219 RepID=UPI0007B00141|nr:hypothetical protein [Ralstonia mannitolilytica]ANA34450.1 hypothetical protein VZ52_14185 [Ralstonia mannitolilytica]MBU9579577.1 hypothetical protein [Ralstonia mannitolilytica]CAJ0804987.1 hypothetical protein LMG18090_04715 [Ralstonia mannitolilytica]